MQLLTKSAIDLLDQWFETDVLKATMAASGIIGTFQGVRSPGTAYVLLHHYMGEIDGAFRSWGLPRGGTGAISNAIAAAAAEAGVEIRTETPVARILMKNGTARGVVLENGDEITAKVVASSLDPRLTFLRMVGQEHLPDEFVQDINRYKFRGSSGKVNLALDGLPNFTSLPGPGAHLRGAISISPSVEYMERAYDEAKYGRYSRRPYIDIVIPSLTDPSVAPPGKHVMSCFVQYAPYDLKEGTWDANRKAFGDTVIDTISEYAPNLKDLILHRQVLTPLDIERQTGLSEGNIFQGELTLEQLFFLRPGPRLGPVPHARAQPLHVRLGHPPRRRHHGSARPERGRAHPARGDVTAMARDARDVIIIGAGHNGLTTAAYLARAGLRPLVLEARATVGGPGGHRGDPPRLPLPHRDPRGRAAAAPGGARAGPRAARAAVAGAEGAGVRPRARRPLAGPARRRRPDRRRPEARWAGATPRSTPSFAATLARIGAALSPLLSMTPPSTEDPSGARPVEPAQARQAAARAGQAGPYRVLRWGPMAVVRLRQRVVRERAPAGGHRRPRHPRHLRRAPLGRHQRRHPAAGGPRRARHRARRVPQGGHGRAQRRAGRRRPGRGGGDPHRRPGGPHLRQGRGGHRGGARQRRGDRRLGGGLERRSPPHLPAACSTPPPWGRSSWARSATTAAWGPPPRSTWRCPGCPAGRAAAPGRQRRHGGRLTGRIHIGPSIDYLERAYDAAKYGEISPRPYLDVSIPTLLDPGLAPDGGHVMSIHAQFVPYLPDATARGNGHNGKASGKNGHGDTELERQREEVARVVIETLAEYAPDLPKVIVGQQVLTPARPRAGVQPQRRAPAARRAGPRPALRLPPAGGLGAVPQPHRPPLPVRLGDPPRRRRAITGASGANASREILKDLG